MEHLTAQINTFVEAQKKGEAPSPDEISAALMDAQDKIKTPDAEMLKDWDELVETPMCFPRRMDTIAARICAALMGKDNIYPFQKSEEKEVA